MAGDNSIADYGAESDEQEAEETPLRAPLEDIPTTPMKLSRESKSLDDLQTALDTALEVNRHLNGEVEQLILERDRALELRDAAVSHAEALGKKLRDVQLTGAVRSTGISQRHGGREEGASEAPSDGSSPNRKPRQPNEAYPSSPAVPAAPGESPEADILALKEWEELRRKGAAGGWLVDPQMVEVGAASGSGSFGSVKRATWRGADVVVKEVRVDVVSEAVSFLREVEVMSSVRHPCVLPFVGAVLDPAEGQSWILAEYMPGGNLREWLYGPKGTRPGARPRRALSERLQKALEVACGMQALQENDPQVMHRDLKPSNVLIDASGVARVADMGLARRYSVETAGVLTGETGTYLYMAPEVVQHNEYDTKADVFSWGIMAAELVTQRMPYEEMYMTPMQVALGVCHHGTRPTLPISLHPGVAKLLKATWDADPTKRPFFREVARKMRKFIEHVLLDEQDAEEAAAKSVTGGLLRGFGWGGARPRSALQQGQQQ